jgi:hypothetical protein
VYSYSTSGLSFSNSCVINQNLYSISSITTSNNVNVGGNIYAYGSGGITLNNNTIIGGNAYASAGSITVESPAQITGSATASGSIYYNTGSQSWYGSIKGSVTYNAQPSAFTTPMPTEPTFPALTDPTKAQWQASEYTNYILITSAGESVNGGALNTAEGCSNYFNSQYLAANNYSASASQFNLDVNNATTPTVIDASACSAPNLYGPGGVSTFTLHTDVAVVLSGLQTSGTNTFTSSSSTSHNLSFIVPSPGTGGINLANNTTFSSSLNVFMYTEGTFQGENSSTLNGQVLAGTYVQGSNGFALSFSSAAATTIPGTTTIPAGSGTTATAGSIATIRRFVSR